MKNEMNEILTPETDAMASMRRATSEWVALAKDLERRLIVEKNRAEDMGKLAHANACEAMEYRRLLTIAREALESISKNAQPSGPFWHGGEIQTKVREAIIITTPKP
jgi:hypothetical protein